MPLALAWRCSRRQSCCLVLQYSDVSVFACLRSIRSSHATCVSCDSTQGVRSRWARPIYLAVHTPRVGAQLLTADLRVPNPLPRCLVTLSSANHRLRAVLHQRMGTGVQLHVPVHAGGSGGAPLQRPNHPRAVSCGSRVCTCATTRDALSTSHADLTRVPGVPADRAPRFDATATRVASTASGATSALSHTTRPFSRKWRATSRLLSPSATCTR